MNTLTAKTNSMHMCDGTVCSTARKERVKSAVLVLVSGAHTLFYFYHPPLKSGLHSRPFGPCPAPEMRDCSQNILL